MNLIIRYAMLRDSLLGSLEQGNKRLAQVTARSLLSTVRELKENKCANPLSLWRADEQLSKLLSALRSRGISSEDYVTAQKTPEPEELADTFCDFIIKPWKAKEVKEPEKPKEAEKPKAKARREEKKVIEVGGWTFFL